MEHNAKHNKNFALFDSLFLPLSPLSTFYLICTVTDREKSNKKNSQFNNSMRGYKRYQRRLSRWQQEKAAALQKATYWTPPPSNKRVLFNGIFYTGALEGITCQI
ncbi:hypothetical protein Zmor_010593 [Zophobas morio]|uniref:Uncharacterized protein n=1 Tax=Zophobas morio TaxID=2755281 RepID=A0AA38IKF7_9CUCU|nr:hypothetical protein Zmor_010593 [Zophobas morio]